MFHDRTTNLVEARKQEPTFLKSRLIKILQKWYAWYFQGEVPIARALAAMMIRTMVNRFVGGLTEFSFVKNQLQCKMMKLKLIIWKFHVLSNILYHLMRTWKEINLSFVLIFGCIFPKHQSFRFLFFCSCLRGFTVVELMKFMKGFCESFAEILNPLLMNY